MERWLFSGVCWHSPGLGQRSRPINLWQPLNSLKLLKCGVVVRGESRLTQNLVSVAGSDKDLRDPEFWCVSRAVPGQCKGPCCQVYLQHSLGSMAAQEQVPRCGAVLSDMWERGSQGSSLWSLLQGLLTEIGSSCLLKPAREIKTAFRGLRSGPKLEAMWKHWLDRLSTFKIEIFHKKYARSLGIDAAMILGDWMFQTLSKSSNSKWFQAM